MSIEGMLISENVMTGRFPESLIRPVKYNVPWGDGCLYYECLTKYTQGYFI